MGAEEPLGSESIGLSVKCSKGTSARKARVVSDWPLHHDTSGHSIKAYVNSLRSRGSYKRG